MNSFRCPCDGATPDHDRTKAATGKPVVRSRTAGGPRARQSNTTEFETQPMNTRHPSAGSRMGGGRPTTSHQASLGLPLPDARAHGRVGRPGTSRQAGLGRPRPAVVPTRTLWFKKSGGPRGEALTGRARGSPRTMYETRSQSGAGPGMFSLVCGRGATNPWSGPSGPA